MRSQPTRSDGVVNRVRISAVAIVLLACCLGAAQERSPGTDGISPRSPEDSLESMRVGPGLRVELVAHEPLVVDPVAIDFGPDGRLWVAEMHDYPSGMKGRFEVPGGRVKVLVDVDSDGIFDRGTVFLDELPFPTGVTVWRGGALVCAAPDILYAEDTDGDGRADVRRVLFTGFATTNYQARVNSLAYGLDGWVWGANGLIGGLIDVGGGKTIDIRGRDFRMRPDTGEFELVSGLTQQGRVRDDAGHWFGCDNGTLARHYPLDDRYVRRNPFVIAPPPAVNVASGPDASRLFPPGELVLFELSGPPGRPTAVCGLTIYRDRALGDAYLGNAFSCESVNQVVHRLVLSPHGSTFLGDRAPEERTREFLASADNWFRPVQARTGTDGALWVVDMYRYVIEHPRWIPPATLARLDLRAGAGMGRIYRVVPDDRREIRIPRLDHLDTTGLVRAMDTANGTVRDLVQQQLVWRGDRSARRGLERLATTSDDAYVRVQALATLDVLGVLDARTILSALDDSDASVRRHAIRVAEGRIDDVIGARLLGRVDDPDPQVRLQLAATLGEWADPRAGAALGEILLAGGDAWLVGAALSSARPHVEPIVAALSRASAGGRSVPASIWDRLSVTAAAANDEAALAAIIESVGGAARRSEGAGQLRVRDLVASLEGKDRGLRALHDRAKTERLRRAIDGLAPIFAAARRDAIDPSVARSRREVAIDLLARGVDRRDEDGRLLRGLLAPRNAPAVQAAAIRAFGRFRTASVATDLLAGWRGYSPRLQKLAWNVLSSRPAWTVALLERGVDDRTLLLVVDTTSRQRLYEHASPAVREAAARAFGRRAKTPRAAVVDTMRAAIVGLGAGGDATRGRRVFEETCAACHRLDGVGTETGPDLAALTDYSVDALLIAILDPNRAALAEFIAYAVVLRDGRVLDGLISAETASSFTLTRADGSRQDVLRADVASLESTGLSFMPEGLEESLDAGKLADVIAFFAAARRAAAGE